MLLGSCVPQSHVANHKSSVPRQLCAPRAEWTWSKQAGCHEELVQWRYWWGQAGYSSMWVHDSHILQVLPLQSLLHHLAVSLPQLEHKIREWGCILFVSFPSQGSMILGQEQEMNEESRVLLLHGHRLYCMRFFIYERSPPQPAWGATRRGRTHRPRQHTQHFP